MAFNELSLHSGGSVVSLDELAADKTPKSTKTYYPIPHITLLELTKDALIRTGLRITNENHALMGQRYFGLMDLKSEHADRTITLGIRNSHDKKFPAGIALGNRVFVCSNLSFSGEVTFRRKHTTFIQRDLPQIVSAAVGRINDFEVSQTARIEAYKNTELSTEQADHAMMSALRAQIIPGSTLPKVLAEYLQPRYDEFAREGFTVWRLYNSFTEFMKNNLWTLPRRSLALHAILDKFVKMPLEGELA